MDLQWHKNLVEVVLLWTVAVAAVGGVSIAAIVAARMLWKDIKEGGL